MLSFLTSPNRRLRCRFFCRYTIHRMFPMLSFPGNDSKSLRYTTIFSPPKSTWGRIMNARLFGQKVGVMFHPVICGVYGTWKPHATTTAKCKKTVTKTVSENASIREKNCDETAFFTLSRCRISLFPRSKHSFYVAKAALLHAKSYAFSMQLISENEEISKLV